MTANGKEKNAPLATADSATARATLRAAHGLLHLFEHRLLLDLDEGPPVLLLEAEPKVSDLLALARRSRFRVRVGVVRVLLMVVLLRRVVIRTTGRVRLSGTAVDRRLRRLLLLLRCTGRGRVSAGRSRDSGSDGGGGVGFGIGDVERALAERFRLGGFLLLRGGGGRLAGGRACRMVAEQEEG